MTDHRNLYKNAALDSKELRRRREEDSTQLRKQKRDDILSKRRFQPADIDDDISQHSLDGINDSNSSSSPDLGPASITAEVIRIFQEKGDDAEIISSAQRVRKILSKDPQPPFDGVIQSGLVPCFVELLDRHDCPTLQFEVAWILTNICSGTPEQTAVVVANGAIPKLVQLTSSPDLRVREQVVWALGNIIGDGPECRDMVIAHNFIPPLLALITPDMDLGFLRNVTWVLVNICRSKDPPPHINVVKQLIPAIFFLIQSTDLNTLIDTTWAVSYITELGQEYSQIVVESELVKRLVPLLKHTELKVQMAAVRALGAIVTGNEEQTQAVIEAGALEPVHHIIKEGRSRVVKDSLWFISNIAAGTTDQIQMLIDEGMIPSIINHLDKGDFAQQREAAWVIYNMSLTGRPAQHQVLIRENVIPALCNLLNLKDQTVVRNTLESLSCLLGSCRDGSADIQLSIEECGGLDKLELLQTHENSEIGDFASNIIEHYFSE